jgi:hypothetical protein
VTDLETRVRDDLVSRAEEVGPWAVPGARLRRAAQRRRAARRRVVAAVTAAVAVAGVVGGLMTGRGAPPAPDGGPTVPPVTGGPDADLGRERSWTSVELTDGMLQRAVVAASGGTDMDVLVSTRLPGSEEVLAVLASAAPDGSVRAVTVTFASADPDATVRRGTAAAYPSYDSLIAQPAVHGDGAVLVVIVPSTVGDTVEVTSSEPGRPSVRTSGFLHDRLAFVPIGRPDAVTRLRVLHRGEPRLDTIPAGALLGPDVPRTVDRIVATTREPRPEQPVQVRTDGRTACRLTAGAWWPDGQPAMDWNPFDAGCAELDGSLQLLLAEDLRYSSVAGVAPAGARSVRLHWAGGAVTDVPTVGGDVNAFLAPVARRPDRLVRAQALDAAGAVVAEVAPLQN